MTWQQVAITLTLLAVAVVAYAIFDGQNTIPWWDSPLTK